MKVIPRPGPEPDTSGTRPTDPSSVYTSRKGNPWVILGPVGCHDCLSSVVYVRAQTRGHPSYWADVYDDVYYRPHACWAKALARPDTPLDVIEALWKTRP